MENIIMSKKETKLVKEYFTNDQKNEKSYNTYSYNDSNKHNSNKVIS